MFTMLTRSRLTLILVAALTLTAAPKLSDPNNPTGNTGLILIDKVGHHLRFFDPKTWTEICFRISDTLSLSVTI